MISGERSKTHCLDLPLIFVFREKRFQILSRGQKMTDQTPPRHNPSDCLLVENSPCAGKQRGINLAPPENTNFKDQSNLKRFPVTRPFARLYAGAIPTLNRFQIIYNPFIYKQLQPARTYLTETESPSSPANY